MHAGHALGLAGLGLAHAMAQAVGGAYGLAARRDERALPAAGARVQPRLRPVGGSPSKQAGRLARLGGFERLRDFGVPEADLPALGAAAAARGGNKANPRVATPDEITELFRSIY